MNDDLGAVAALHDPVRRALYDYVAAQGRAVGRNEAAESVGISRTLAAFHLDKLAEVGLLETGFIGLLLWIPRPLGRGGNGTLAEQGRDSRSAAKADGRPPACHREGHWSAC